MRRQEAGSAMVSLIAAETAAAIVAYARRRRRNHLRQKWFDQQVDALFSDYKRRTLAGWLPPSSTDQTVRHRRYDKSKGKD